MRTLPIFSLLFFILCLSFIILSCSSSPFDDTNNDFPDPDEGVATDILLLVYSNGYGTLLDTIRLESEGSLIIDIDEAQPFTDPPSYYIYALATGYYTKLYHCSKGARITVDLGKVPNAAASMTGVIFRMQPFFTDSYYANKSVFLRNDAPFNHDPGFTVLTDSLGRWGLAGVPIGPWVLTFSSMGMDYTYELANNIGTDYSDLYFLDGLIAYAPNIYLYPESEREVAVTLDIPSGGHVTVSEPEYEDGWQVQVTPEGLIDGRYAYLFYEAKVVMPLQSQTGWMLDGSQLALELEQLLASLGFVGREIDDFVEHWVPRIEGSNWYAIYPQEPELMSLLYISPAPDKLLRTLFVIRPLNQPILVVAPDITPFVREGFTAVEWGVIGWLAKPD